MTWRNGDSASSLSTPGALLSSPAWGRTLRSPLGGKDCIVSAHAASEMHGLWPGGQWNGKCNCWVGLPGGLLKMWGLWFVTLTPAYYSLAVSAWRAARAWAAVLDLQARCWEEEQERQGTSVSCKPLFWGFLLQAAIFNHITNYGFLQGLKAHVVNPQSIPNHSLSQQMWPYILSAILILNMLLG